jgi:uncharacterized protein YkwD
MPSHQKRKPILGIALVGTLAVAIAAIVGWHFYSTRNYWHKKPQIDITALERRIHDLTNAQRRSRGIPALEFDDLIAKIARTHSQDMISRGFFEHINPNGEDPGARGRKMGYQCVKNYATYYTEGLSENLMHTYLYDSQLEHTGIAIGYDWRTPEEIAQITIDGWMNSPGHRRTLLTATYDREGIGVVISSDREVFVTQDFC